MSHFEFHGIKLTNEEAKFVKIYHILYQSFPRSPFDSYSFFAQKKAFETCLKPFAEYSN